MIVVGRIMKVKDGAVLIEPYGTPDDFYEMPDREAQKWVKTHLIRAVDDSETDEYTDWEDLFIQGNSHEFTMTAGQAKRLLYG